MYFKNIKENDKTITFQLHNLHRSFASALRRTLLADIPVYGLDDFEVQINTSNMYHNDFITHTISGIPLIGIGQKENIDDITFTLDESSTIDDEIRIIYSNDIKSSNGKKYLWQDIPIIKLYPGKALKLTAKATKRTAKENAFIYGAIETPKFKHIESSTNKYKNEINPIVEFSITSICNYTPKYMLFLACETIIKQLQDIKDYIVNADNYKINNVIISELNTDYVIITISNIDHTIANLIKGEAIVSTSDIMSKGFIGYKKNHPTEEIIEFKIKYNEPVKFFLTHIESLIDLTEKVKHELKE